MKNTVHQQDTVTMSISIKMTACKINMCYTGKKKEQTLKFSWIPIHFQKMVQLL